MSEKSVDAILIIGGEVRFDTLDDPDAGRRIRETLGQLLQVKNLAVLVGSGASFHLGSPRIRSVGRETIDAMATAANQTLSEAASAALDALLGSECVDLEELLASLTNALSYAESIGLDSVSLGEHTATRDVLTELRRAVNASLAVACDLPKPQGIDGGRFKSDPWAAHREFFRRLLRSRRADLPRVRVFTTNYDLVIERTLDDAGVPYFDGFVGTVNRVMQLESYQQDLYLPPQADGRRLVRAPNVMYLYKLHGSINWRSGVSPAGHGTVHVEQSGQGSDDEELVLIYPTPQKEADVLGHPYADLLRAFSTTLSAPETALVTVGYGFADQHINRLILQALPSNPTLQVLIVDPRGVLTRKDGQPGEYDFDAGPVSSLAQVADQRLAVLTGDDASFAKLAEGLMPDPDDFAFDESTTLASALADAMGRSGPTEVEAEAGS